MGGEVTEGTRHHQLPTQSIHPRLLKLLSACFVTAHKPPSSPLEVNGPQRVVVHEVAEPLEPLVGHLRWQLHLGR